MQILIVLNAMMKIMDKLDVLGNVMVQTILILEMYYAKKMDAKKDIIISKEYAINALLALIIV